MTSTTSSFAASHDLSGLPPGIYTLTVRARDSANRTTTAYRILHITADRNLVRTPVSYMTTAGQDVTLLAVDSGKALYGTRAEWPATDLTGLFLADLQTGAQVTLSNAPSIVGDWSIPAWQMRQGRTYRDGSGTDCLEQCIYEWKSDGTLRNLSNANPNSATSYTASGRTWDHAPLARGIYVLWQHLEAPGPSNRVTLYNTTLETFREIVLPTGNSVVDFTVADNLVRVYYTVRDGAGSRDIYRWDSDTGTSTRLTSDSGQKTDVRVDGDMLAWFQPASAAEVNRFAGWAPPQILRALPDRAGVPITLSTLATHFEMKDGVVAWREYVSPPVQSGLEITGPTYSFRTWTAATGTAEVTSNGRYPDIWAIGAGRVFYGEGVNLYSWTPSTATRTLLIDGSAGPGFVSDGAFFFQLHTAIHRIPF